MNEQVDFTCPGCKRACRVSQKQRAVQHQVPDCKLFTDHKRAGTMQEFLRLALMATGGAAFNLGNVTLDVAPSERRPHWVPDEVHVVSRPEQPQFTDRQRNDVIEELSEGLKKL